MLRAYADVESELLEAVLTYESQRPGRGLRFLTAVGQVISRIREKPLQFPKSQLVKRPVLRKAKLLRWPYSVFYVVRRGEPIVLAVAHARRHPALFVNRLRSPASLIELR